MLLSYDTIKAAFRKHGEYYHRRKGWQIDYHLTCLARAARAFDECSLDEFEWIYGQMKSYWQVFRRSSGEPWSAERTYDHLRGLDADWRKCQLTTFSDSDLTECWQIIDSISGIKPLKSGTSVVAISKSLHVWNPGLFVIVDDAIIWRWVFAHGWLRRQIDSTRDRIGSVIGVEVSKGEACDMLSYLAVLRWSADVLRDNSAIMPCFAEHVDHFGGESAANLHHDRLEAVAIEWLLLGLVALPPAGVMLDCTGDSVNEGNS